MELIIIYGIIIGIIIAIMAFPIWLMVEVNIFLGIAVIVVYEIFLMKTYNVPVISVSITFILRLGLFLLLSLLILSSIVLVAVSCFHLSFEGAEVFTDIMQALKYYVG